MTRREDDALLNEAQAFVDREKHRWRDELVALGAFVVSIVLLWLALYLAPMVAM